MKGKIWDRIEECKNEGNKMWERKRIKWIIEGVKGMKVWVKRNKEN